MKRLGSWGAIVAGLLGLSALALYRLTIYPPTWFDEGSHLHVPKALVRWGVYADYSSEGFRFHGPILGVGPTVLLPIAGAFRIFGVGLWSARWVMAMFLLVTVCLFAAVARRWVPGIGAIFAVLWFVFARSADTLTYGRQVLGEVPGMAFLLIGMLGWEGMWRNRPWGAGLAGLGFGLAGITKGPWWMFLIPALVGLSVAGRFYYRQPGWAGNLKAAGIALALGLAWQGMLWGLLNPNPLRDLQELRQIAGGSVAVFPSPRMGATARNLLTVFDGAFLPLFLYGAWRALERSPQGYRWGLVMAIVALNLGWLVTASNGWLRYAYPALALLSLNAGDLLAVLRAREAQALQAAMGLWLAILLLGSAGIQVVRVLRHGDDAAFQMARYLQAHVPEDALIETWEPEMGVLTDHRYHYPPQAFLDVASRFVWFGGPPPARFYHWDEARPDYVLVGAFGRWVELYREVEERCPELTAAFGPYRLYRIATCAPQAEESEREGGERP
ncbi:glycosyltransferase family 39 protein [Thermoflexus sp.]|uniref:ArnT family glycosyltransferase n=1 Tax=Thermoflexus sp. TaxID=1969742 RepID=UPI0033307509